MLGLTSGRRIAFIVERGLAFALAQSRASRNHRRRSPRWRNGPRECKQAVPACANKNLRRLGRLLLLRADHLPLAESDNVDALQNPPRAMKSSGSNAAWSMLEIIVHRAPLLTGWSAPIAGMNDAFGDIGLTGLERRRAAGQGHRADFECNVDGSLQSPFRRSSRGVISAKKSRCSPSRWRRSATTSSAAIPEKK